MRIAEIYNSVQGEGFLTGTESVFVRTSGCNLRCWFCDTPYASWNPESNDLSVQDILERTCKLDRKHVVITGGEPMLQAELIPLCTELRSLGLHITIETAGTLYLPVDCDLMSISPKFASSAPAKDQHPEWHSRHQRTRTVAEVIRQLLKSYTYQIKFVVDSPGDCDAAQAYLGDFPEIDRSRAMLMPQGVNREKLERTAEWLECYCREHQLKYCPRRQIEWFGLTRGT